MIIEHLKENQRALLKSEQVNKYVIRCTEICWLMAIQDPPMAITVKINDDSKYDNRLFRVYTKEGDFVDYVVWPAVLIQDGGHLMCKGIVQCCDVICSETNECDKYTY